MRVNRFSLTLELVEFLSRLLSTISPLRLSNRGVPWR